MNLNIICRLLGKVAWLIGGTMAFSIPWAFPVLGKTEQVEQRALYALLISMFLSFLTGYVLNRIGRKQAGSLYRKEAMATVGLSWILATILGALPFFILGSTSYRRDAEGNPVHLSVADALFESQSGFSTTGATLLTDLEDPELVPRCILFWRSSTHFLGGLGIIVLFVVILGQGSAGKALMRAEMPGPSKEGSHSRMQHTAWLFAAIYCGLNVVLTIVLMLGGMDLFDGLCHAFGTMATGGFSTYNASVGHFATSPGYNWPLIEWTIILFMILAGTNFTLLYFLIIQRAVKRLFQDVEWRAYMGIILFVTTSIVVWGMWHHDFEEPNMNRAEELAAAVRNSTFQVVSILTTTGYGTHDFNQWNSFGRGVLFLLMFVGGCAGSTGGGLKVIRHVLFLKILKIEVERSYHPSVVRPLRVGKETIADPELKLNILVYFGLILFMFVTSWMLVVMIEPDKTWHVDSHSVDNKLIDSATSIAATINNIGPGLGIVGATENYSRFSPLSKLLFTVLMMIGRLEIFAIVVLMLPGFWRKY